VTPQIHLVVQDTTDFDDPAFDSPIQEEVTSRPTMPGNMECAEARHDLVARFRSRDVGTVGKLADRPNECVPIDPGLPRAEILSCPLQNVCEIEFGDSAKANAPPSFAHEMIIRPCLK
jgi:hypothetical protein